MEKEKRERYIFLFRHPLTDANEAGRWCGWTNEPLNPKGKFRGRAMSHTFKQLKEAKGWKIKNIYTSDLLRALEFAEFHQEELNIPIIKERELRETNQGQLEKLSLEEMKELYPEIYIQYKIDKSNLHFPGGESIKETSERVKKTVRKIIKQEDDNDALIVTHAGPVVFTVIALLKLPLTTFNNFETVKNNSLTILKKVEDNYCLSLYSWLPDFGIF